MARPRRLRSPENAPHRAAIAFETSHPPNHSIVSWYSPPHGAKNSLCHPKRFYIRFVSFMSKKAKFYVVWKGRRTGIFTTWEQAKAQVDGFTGAQYKAFDTRAQAEAAFQRPVNLRESRAPYNAQPNV